MKYNRIRITVQPDLWEWCRSVREKPDKSSTRVLFDLVWECVYESELLLVDLSVQKVY